MVIDILSCPFKILQKNQPSVSVACNRLKGYSIVLRTDRERRGCRMYEQGVIRPPSEASSLLVRVTRNCPWNQCVFCPATRV